MTTQTEALKLALEALKQMKAQANFDCWNLDICDEAIAAAEETLAQPEQEPCEYCKRGLKTMCLCPTPPQRKPLTDRQMWEALELALGFEASAQGYEKAFRAAEAAHGIKE